MIMRFLRWLFSSPAPTQRPQPEPTVEERLSFFSTEIDREHDLLTARERKFEKVRAAIAPAHPTTVLRQTATDSADATWAMDSLGDSGIKSSLLMGQSGLPDAQVNWYLTQGFIGYQLCAIIAQHWLVQRACVMPARDAIRKGFQFKSLSDTPLTSEITKAIQRANRKYKLDKNLVEFVKFQRVFGIRVAMFKIDSADLDFYVRPFNPDSVKPGTYRGISQVDPYWMTPELTDAAAFDPSAIDFYEPTYWVINGKRVHKSHLVIIRGPDVADILKPAYLYGGLSIPQQICERVYAAERTANEAPLLALSKRSTIYYTDAAKAIANEGSFLEKLAMWANYRDNWGVKIADRENDKVEQHDTSLADLDTVIMTNYQLVASIAEMPATKLLGTTPKGFNSTGDYETDTYHEMLGSIQVNDMEPLIERHMMCLIRSEIAPVHNDGKIFGVDVVWNPLSELDAVELSAKNKTDAESDQILVTIGAVTAAEVRERLSNDEHSGFRNIPTEVPDDGNDDEEDGAPSDGQAQNLGGAAGASAVQGADPVPAGRPAGAVPAAPVPPR